MANDLNLCVFTGRLAADIDVRFTASGKPVGNMRLAVGRKFKDTEETAWLDVILWDKKAELAAQYLTKGSQCRVTCRVQTRKFEHNGQKRSATEFVCDELQFLGSKSDGQRPAQQGQPPRDRHDNQRQDAQPSDFDDDIPF